jgi:4'-phosphopantetheinyl transferase
MADKESELTNLPEMWHTLSVQPELAEGEVHIWSMNLDFPIRTYPELYELLSNDERERAQNYRLAIHRNRFIMGRATLRILLSSYSGVEPARLIFSYGPWGKPELVPSSQGSTLRFNLSHSEGWTLYAITNKDAVGIDLERIRKNVNIDRIAIQYFSPREIEELQRLPDSLRRHVFFQCWSGKEAFLKACGQGLALPLHRFDVCVAPDGLLMQLHLPPEIAAGQRWQLYSIPCAPEYAAALAVQGDECLIKCWNWPVIPTKNSDCEN